MARNRARAPCRDRVESAFRLKFEELLARAPRGPAAPRLRARALGATNNFAVETPGRLYVASYFPGEWSTRQGDLATPDEAYAGVTGDLDVLILRWQGEPLDGLEHLAALAMSTTCLRSRSTGC